MLHRCDNPPCVNPAHLFLGTDLDNARDRDAKGRRAAGELHGSAKLTAETVRAIRALHTEGAATMRGMARRYGINRSTIKQVILRQTWKHIA